MARRKRPQHAKPDKNQLRINRQIRIPVVYLIDEEGKPVGEVDLQVAQEKADDAGLDLVEVSPNARPPVCKILDFGKYKYKQKKRNQGQKTHQAKVKEVRMHPRTDVHDQMVRVKQATKFLNHGDKVLVTIWFKGREMAHRDIGYKLMENFKTHFPLIAKIEKEPSMEGRKMTMLLAPLAADVRKKLEREAEQAELQAALKTDSGRQRRVISLDDQKKSASETVSAEEPEEEAAAAD